MLLENLQVLHNKNSIVPRDLSFQLNFSKYSLHIPILYILGYSNSLHPDNVFPEITNFVLIDNC